MNNQIYSFFTEHKLFMQTSMASKLVIQQNMQFWKKNSGAGF